MRNKQEAYTLLTILLYPQTSSMIPQVTLIAMHIPKKEYDQIKGQTRNKKRLQTLTCKKHTSF
jgi:hypothetical protein